MDRVFTPAEQSVREIDFAAIAMVRTGNAAQRHIGILHRQAEPSDVALLHLAWHCALRNESAASVALWIDPAVPRLRLRQVAALCRKIWRANQSAVPYAFSEPVDCFDIETGKFLIGPTRVGLTCASFVLAVFHSAGLQLSDYQSWPTNRVDDVEWQETILGLLRRAGSAATPEHIKAVTNEIGNVRFRPEEVAGSATVTPLPASFEDAATTAKAILNRLEISPPLMNKLKGLSKEIDHALAQSIQ